MKGAVHTSILLMELSTSGIRKEGAGSQRYLKGVALMDLLQRHGKASTKLKNFGDAPSIVPAIFEHYEVNIL